MWFIRRFVVPCAFVLFGLAATSARSQGVEPCEPDCHEKPFKGPFYYTQFLSIRKTGGGLCLNEFQIEYYYREGACGQFNDVQITNVRLTGVPDPVCATAYTNLPDIFKAAVRAIIRDNPMHFFPDWDNPDHRPMLGDPPLCATNWRVSAGVCWRVASPPRYGIEACDPLCCVQSFHVCVSSGGSVGFSPVGTPEGGGMCPSGFGPECTPVCDFLNAVGELPDGGNGAEEGDGPALTKAGAHQR